MLLILCLGYLDSLAKSFIAWILNNLPVLIVVKGSMQGAIIFFPVESLEPTDSDGSNQTVWMPTLI